MMILRYVHLVGAALLFGAILGAGVANRVAIQASAQSAGSERGADRAAFELLRLAQAGLVLLLLTGVAQVAMLGTFVMRMPWMHVMLTCFLVAGALAGIAQSRARAIEEREVDVASSRRRITTLCIAAVAVVSIALFAGVSRF